jgi:hypothetical protein
VVHNEEWKLRRLPSTAGKLAKNATNAGGVAFSNSSNALVVPSPTIATIGFDKLLNAAETPDAEALGRISIPTVIK